MVPRRRSHRRLGQRIPPGLDYGIVVSSPLAIASPSLTGTAFPRPTRALVTPGGSAYLAGNVCSSSEAPGDRLPSSDKRIRKALEGARHA